MPRALACLSTLLVAACTTPGEPTGDLEPSDVAPPSPPAGAPHAVPPAGSTTLERFGERVVVADADRDRLWVFDAGSLDLQRAIDLPSGSVPSRMALGDDGLLRVVLQRSGALATVDLEAGEVLREDPVCAGPRGVASWGESTLVACAEGELVQIDRHGDVERRVPLAPDLRDVVVGHEERPLGPEERVFVSTFRSAEVFFLDTELDVLHRAPAPAPSSNVVSRVAYRMRARPEGGVLLLHQAQGTQSVPVERSGYGRGGGDCSALVTTQLSVVAQESFDDAQVRFDGLVLGVDFAFANEQLMIVGAADPEPEQTGLVSSVASAVMARAEEENCLEAVAGWSGGHEEPVQAVVATEDGGFLGWQRQPAALLRFGASGTLLDAERLGDAPYVRDAGHAVFHRATPSGLACASCHPGGRDDGHVWDFGVPLRTQSLVGGISQTAPYHWRGEHADLNALANQAMRERMRGELAPGELEALLGWLDTLPAPATSASPNDAALAEAGCTDCHADAMGSRAESMDVGTGLTLQVPPLVGVNVRGPWMHDGCAETLEEALDGCDGAPHGGRVLEPEQRAAVLDVLRRL